MHVQLGLLFAGGVLLFSACSGGGDDGTEVPTPAQIATAPATFASTATETAIPTTVVATATPVPAGTAAVAQTPAATPTAASAAQATAVPPTPTAPPAPPSPRTVTITARNVSFDQSEIHVRVGAAVTAVFNNTDTGTEHNLSFNLPGLGHPTCVGPCTTTQNFTPSTVGKFAFFCTIHAEMFGDFYVDP
jgi:plastocyanin